MTIRDPFGEFDANRYGHEHATFLARSLALSSAEFFEELVERLGRLERAHEDLRAFVARIGPGFPAAPLAPTLFDSLPARSRETGPREMAARVLDAPGAPREESGERVALGPRAGAEGVPQPGGSASAEPEIGSAWHGEPPPFWGPQAPRIGHTIQAGTQAGPVASVTDPVASAPDPVASVTEPSAEGFPSPFPPPPPSGPFGPSSLPPPPPPVEGARAPTHDFGVLTPRIRTPAPSVAAAVEMSAPRTDGRLGTAGVREKIAPDFFVRARRRRR